MPPRIIIHITGPPASGKTTFGAKLKTVIGRRVRVIDLDKLYMKFSAEATNDGYQEYIDGLITRTKESIVFVGLNMDMNKTHTLYDVHATHKFYLNVATDVLVKRHFLREIKEWADWMASRDHEILYDQLMASRKPRDDLVASFAHVLNLSDQKKMIESFRDKFPDYIAGSPSVIFAKVIRLLS